MAQPQRGAIRAGLRALPGWDQSTSKVNLACQSESVLHHTSGVLELVVPKPMLPKKLVSDTKVVRKLDSGLNHSLAIHRHEISIIVVTWNDDTNIQISSILKIRGDQKLDHVEHS